MYAIRSYYAAVQSLGINDVSEFDINERVLGLPKNPEDALVELKLTDFVDEVSRESPEVGGVAPAAPGGGEGCSRGVSAAAGCTLTSLHPATSSNVLV